MLTKSDIKALRTADCLCVHLGKTNVVRAIKRNPKTETNPFAVDVEHLVTADVGLDTLRGKEKLAAERVQCFAMINLYHSQKHTSALILRTLREGDEIAFRFYPDGYTNGYLAMAGLHGDCLHLYVRRQAKTVAVWDIAHSICPTNTARMVRGVPDSDHYARDAAEHF